MAESRSSGWELLGMGTAVAACLVLPLVIGWFADRALGWTPVLTLVGLALGVAAAAHYTYTQVRRSFGSSDE